MTNAELIKALRICGHASGCPEFCPRYRTYENGLTCAQHVIFDAADALEAADKRIAEMEESSSWKAYAALEESIEGYKKRIAELEAQMPERDAANVFILPCNIGDKIYYCRFDKDGAGWVTPMIVCGIHITKFRTKEKDGEQYLVCELPWFSRSVHVPLKEFGKTLFLTEEEARRRISNA